MVFKNLFFKLNLLFWCMIGGFFIFTLALQAADNDIVINEIGAYESSDHEWIEIYNKGNEAVNLSDWKFYENETNHGLSLFQGEDMIIEPSEYAIIADVAENFATDYPDFNGTIIDSSWGSLKESGELIELRTSSDSADTIESFTYLEAKNASLERTNPELDDYSADNWQEHSNGNTAGQQNSNFQVSDTTPPTKATDLQATAGDGTVDLSWEASPDEDLAGYKLYIDTDQGYGDGTDLGDVLSYQVTNLTNDLVYTFKLTAYDEAGNESEGVTVTITPTAETINNNIFINEIFSDASDEENEWLELYNKNTEDVNLGNWTLSDGVGIIYTFSAEEIIKEENFFTINLSVNKLNNSGDIIILKNTQDTIVDQISYGDWDDGNADDNAPAPNNPNSLARNIDGQDTDINSNDWSITTTATKNTANNITEEENNDSSNETKDNDEKNITEASAVINEILVNPDEENKEWVELYISQGGSLTDWTLSDGVGVIHTFNTEDTINSQAFLTIELTSSKLNNSGDVVILKNDRGTIMDQISYGNRNDGEVSDNAPTPDKSYSLARSTNGQDTDSGSDWQITTTPTKNSANIITPAATDDEAGDNENEDETEDNSTPSTSGGGSTMPEYNPGDLVINELVSDPADSEVEWVELFNNTANSINLSWWTLEDGGEHSTSLQDFINGNDFYVIEKPKGMLNNKGDALLLKFNGQLIDQVVYGDWDDGELSDNAPTADDPYSLARIVDGQDTDNDFNDFVLAVPTKRFANKIYKKQNQQFDYNIVINEFLPNPQGTDTENEFIELKNTDSTEIDLDGWVLGDGSKKRYTIAKEDIDTVIEPGKYLTLYREVTGLALNNSGGDTVKLFTPDQQLAQEIQYQQSAAEGESYNRDADGKWQWSSAPTPDKENGIIAENNPPVAVIEAEGQALTGELIQFDASDSFDPENDKLSYHWNFDTKETSKEIAPLYFYNNPGTYEVSLTVTDDMGLSDTEVVIIEINDESSLSNQTTFSADILINEFIPNPKGSDLQEWIELFNSGNKTIDLSGWQLDDQSAGSSPYTIPDNTMIGAGEYLTFFKNQTKIALNNSSDEVNLINPLGETIQKISYSKVEEGASYARNSTGQWSWSAKPTPSAPNIIQKPKIKTSSSKKTSLRPFIKTELKNIRQYDPGDKVQVQGVVSAPPGLLGKQIFYLSGSGIQVYMYKADFPNLQIGDYIKIQGELSEARGEMRIKLKDKASINFLKHQDPPQPTPLPAGEVNEEAEGHLVFIQGEVIEKKGSSVFVDDGNEEVKVYIKNSTNINKSLQEGDLVKITGVVSQTRSGYRLLPRFNEDIAITGSHISDTQKQQAVLKKTVKEQSTLKYLSATSMALIIALGGLMMRMRKDVKQKK